MQKRFIGIALLGTILMMLGLATAAAQAQERPECNGELATLWVGQGGNGGTVFELVDGEIVNQGDYFRNELGGYVPLEGTDGDDVIVGSSNNDTIFGFGGDDTICGGNAQDIIDGGAGDDTLIAGDGTDQCILGDSFADTTEGCESVSPGNLVEVASSLPDFSILVQAVVAAGLADTLANDGPFTVFAPTNAAFEALLADLGLTAEELLASPILGDVLLYHVLNTPAPAEVVLTLDGVNLGNAGAGLNLLGEDLIVETTPLSLIDGTDTPANVTTVDVFASNGVIHVIDKVLLPPSIVEALAGEGEGDMGDSEGDDMGDSAMDDMPEEGNDDEPVVIEEPITPPTCNGLEATLWVGPGGNGGIVYQNVGGEIISLGDYFRNELGAYLPLEGTEEADVIVGSSNNDRIFGRGGDDTICGGNAQDSIDGGDGDDTIFGEDGDDQLFGRDGDDAFDGGSAQDVCELGDSFADTTEGCESVSPGNLVEVASSLPDFSILVQAVVAAGLADTLANDGPFTVFAPTNAAFEALLADLGLTAEELLASPILGDVLLYHVLNTPAPAEVVLTLDGVNLGNAGAGLNLLGEDLIVETTPLSLIDGTDTPANVTTVDVFASNGVIHVIDKVLLPPSIVEALGLGDEEEPEIPATVVDIALSNPDNFSILVDALTEAELVDDLQGEGPFTVLAPTNDAFAALATKLGISAEDLLASPILAQILLYHVIPAEADEATVRTLTEAPTLINDFDTVGITVNSEGDIIIDGIATVTITDLVAENGIVHVIDTVLEPSIFSAPTP